MNQQQQQISIPLVLPHFSSLYIFSSPPNIYYVAVNSTYLELASSAEILIIFPTLLTLSTSHVCSLLPTARPCRQTPRSYEPDPMSDLRWANSETQEGHSSRTFLWECRSKQSPSAMRPSRFYGKWSLPMSSTEETALTLKLRIT